MANLFSGMSLESAVAKLVREFKAEEDGSGVMTAEEFKALAFKHISCLQNFEYTALLLKAEKLGEFEVDPESGMVTLFPH